MTQAQKLQKSFSQKNLIEMMKPYKDFSFNTKKFILRNMIKNRLGE